MGIRECGLSSKTGHDQNLTLKILFPGSLLVAVRKTETESAFFDLWNLLYSIGMYGTEKGKSNTELTPRWELQEIASTPRSRATKRRDGVI